jgi:hypothetical protein
MEKLDLTKHDKAYFTAKQTPTLVELGRAFFISLVGKGDPSGSDFAKQVEALYSVAYRLKFLSKAAGKDFVVSKLEGLWWYDEARYPRQTIDTAPLEIPRSEWEYRLLIRVPAFITPDLLGESIARVLEKNCEILAHEVDYFELEEGKCVQMLHVGPFATEKDTLKEMAAYISSNRLERNGLHHEIYLSDFRKTAPEKCRTILREPVK